MQKLDLMQINGRPLYLCSGRDGAGGPAFYWPVGGENREEQITTLASLLPQERPWLLAAFPCAHWSEDLSPWAAEPGVGESTFSGHGPDTLGWLLQDCIPLVQRQCPEIEGHFPCGYSMGGLFALWALYQSPAFSGAVSCSGSLWYPGWQTYAASRRLPAQSLLYLSLGDREEHTWHPLMCQVGETTRQQYQHACQELVPSRCTLQWEPGGHFRQPEQRLARGLRWIISKYTNNVQF